MQRCEVQRDDDSRERQPCHVVHCRDDRLVVGLEQA
jgi:hypothetical protein